VATGPVQPARCYICYPKR